MNDTFMKERPVLPLLLSMALPNVISMLVNSLYNIVDSLFVAQISEDAMTALSLVYPIQNFANAIAIGFGIGINAMIAGIATTMCGGDWHVAMSVIFLEGIVILLLVLCGLREAIMDAIPVALRQAIGIGIGLFVAFIGVNFLVEFAVNAVLSAAIARIVQVVRKQLEK